MKISQRSIASELLHQFGGYLARPLAFGIGGAAQEVAAATEATLAQLHRPAALRTRLRDRHLRQLLLHRRRRQLVLELLLQLVRQRLGAAALRIGTATQERAPRALF